MAYVLVKDVLGLVTPTPIEVGVLTFKVEVRRFQNELKFDVIAILHSNNKAGFPYLIICTSLNDVNKAFEICEKLNFLASEYKKNELLSEVLLTLRNDFSISIDERF